jgi:Family of unknown function (DUF5709)
MADDSDGVDGEDTDSGVLEPDESLDDTRVEDVLDEGYSPVERPLAFGDYGLTAREAAEHEQLDARLAREVPDAEPATDDGLGDTEDTDGEPYDAEVGTARAGRLADTDTDGDSDDYQYLLGRDVGIDGGSASAEEAAVHIVGEEPDYR